MWRPGAILATLAAGACGRSGPSHSTAPASGEGHPGSAAAPHTPSDPPPPPTLDGADDHRDAAASGNRCDTVPVSDLSVDGLLDDWKGTHVVARAVAHVGSPTDGSVSMRCAWDGDALAVMLDIHDDRLVRVKRGVEDRVTISVGAGEKPVIVTVFPGNAIEKSKITKPARAEAADSLQPQGFSVEVVIPAAAIPGYSPATPAFDLAVLFEDSDAATGGNTSDIEIKQPLELADRKDLLDDFLTAVKLKKTDIKLDALVELDPDRKGKERIVAGGNVIGILTDQFAYVTLPAATPSDVKKIELLSLGTKGQQVVSAVVRQSGNGGSRDLLMLWTVWSGQLQPLVNIEVRKELAGNVLESTYKVAKGPKPKQLPELIVEPKPAVGFTPESWNEEPAGDSDSILVPWDTTKSGIAYSLRGAEIERRELAKKKK